MNNTTIGTSMTKLSRVVFAMPVQDPSAQGLFERRDFRSDNARVTLERSEDGTIYITSITGAQVVASGIPYWCNPMREEACAQTGTVKEVPKKEQDRPQSGTLLPVTQSQAHPMERKSKRWNV